MIVIFNKGDQKDLAMFCSKTCRLDQEEMMHRLDIDEQVKNWQLSNTGQPPIFRSRIKIKEFTNKELKFSNIKF